MLDGLLKLKESDPGALPKQQLESYMRAVETLREDMERVITACSMFPCRHPRDALSAMDALYEVEERCMPEVAQWMRTSRGAAGSLGRLQGK